MREDAPPKKLAPNCQIAAPVSVLDVNGGLRHIAHHDHALKLLFAHPRLTGDLVRDFLPPAVAREFDAGTLEPCPTEHLSDSLQARVGDLVWRLRLRSGQAVYLMLEFQSAPDRTMALRMLAYAALLAQGLARRGELSGRGRLPPILPVVLYNGPQPWRAAEEVSALFAAAPRAFRRFGPRQRYLLLDVETLPEPVGDNVNLAALLFRLERSRTVEETLAGLAALRRGLALEASPELQRAFSTWLRRASRARGAFGISMEEDETMAEKRFWVSRSRSCSSGRWHSWRTTSSPRG